MYFLLRDVDVVFHEHFVSFISTCVVFGWTPKSAPIKSKLSAGQDATSQVERKYVLLQ